MPVKKNRTKARQKYYVIDPSLVLTIGEFEMLVHHLMAMGLSYDQSPTARGLLMEKHGQIMRKVRQKLNAAKAHYNIEVEAA